MLPSHCQGLPRGWRSPRQGHVLGVSHVEPTSGPGGADGSRDPQSAGLREARSRRRQKWSRSDQEVLTRSTAREPPGHLGPGHSDQPQTLWPRCPTCRGWEAWPPPSSPQILGDDDRRLVASSMTWNWCPRLQCGVSRQPGKASARRGPPTRGLRSSQSRGRRGWLVPALARRCPLRRLHHGRDRRGVGR